MTKRDEREILEQAAEAVADTTSLDWQSLLAESPGLAPTLRRLEAIGQIAAAYRANAERCAGEPDIVDPAMPDSPSRLAPLFTWGHLRVLEKLGEGGFGDIYRAFDPMLCREVALKLARRDAGVAGAPARRALEEARRLARVRHPNVLAVHGADVRAGRVGIWTDLLGGRTLEDRLRAAGPLGAQEAALIGLDLCRALAAVHAAGLVHGDVKAANVIQEESGATILLDFGSGRDLRAAGAPELVTGTPLTLAPEVLAGDLPAPAADLYALGVLLYRLTTCRYPIATSSLSELMAKHEAGESVPLGDARPDLPPAFVRVVDRALAPLGRRFASAGEMERALADALLEMAAPPARLPSRRPRGAARGREPRHNLPAPITRFVGRARELDEIRDLVRRKRLVTLTGAGGAGKTRLALEVAARVRRHFPDGAWLAELAPVSDPAAVSRTLARALGLKERPGLELEEELVRHLGDRLILVILDNCEHLRGACGALAAELLGRGAKVHVLATSREDLGVTGETIYHVPPLPTPERDAVAPEDLARIESAELFTDRAAAVNSRFALDAATAPSVARICRRLDGMPLALELAAARVRALPVEEIARRIDDRFAFLAGGNPAALPRHQTLRALIDWSYELLPKGERSLFRRLSAFAGGWTLEAGDRVCAGDGVEAVEVVGLLANLVGKSLVERDGRARYRMLETVRQYARERCEAEGEWRALTRRFRAYLVGLAEEADPHLTGPEQSAWLARLAAEHDNLRAAIEAFTGADADIEGGMRLVRALGRYLWARGHWSEGRAMCRRLLAHPLAPAEGAARAAVLTVAGDLAHRQGDTAEARVRHEEALAIWRRLGDRAGIAVSLGMLGNIALAQGDYPGARALFEESLALRRESDHRWGAASAVLNLGRVAFMQGQYDEARAAFAESLAVARELGHDWGISASLTAMATLEATAENYAEARIHFLESLQLMRELGDPSGAATCLLNLGIVSIRIGDPERARSYLEEALAAARDLQEVRTEALVLQNLAELQVADGDHEAGRCLLLQSLGIFHEAQDLRLLALVLAQLGRVASAAGDPLRGFRLLAAATGLRRTIGAVPRPDQQREEDALAAAARAALGEAAAEQAWSKWLVRPLAEVLEYATAATATASPRPARFRG
jgi:non-specific serine/threonine protein kinase